MKEDFPKIRHIDNDAGNSQAKWDGDQMKESKSEKNINMVNQVYSNPELMKLLLEKMLLAEAEKGNPAIVDELNQKAV